MFSGRVSLSPSLEADNSADHGAVDWNCLEFCQHGGELGRWVRTNPYFYAIKYFEKDLFRPWNNFIEPSTNLVDASPA